MTTAEQVADALGRKAIADAAGVGVTAVSNAVVRNRFPATWFLAVTGLAKGAGQQCPPELFGMKPANYSPSSHPSAGFEQVDGSLPCEEPVNDPKSVQAPATNSDSEK